MNEWIRWTDAIPADGQVFVALNDTHEVLLQRSGNLLWFWPERDMYVYFTPTLWRPYDERRQA